MAKLQYISRTGKRSYSYETDSEIFAGNISTSNISSSDITAHRLTARSIALQYDSDYSYRAGEIIENGGKLYKANSDMPAKTIFVEGKDALEWSPISADGGVEPFDSTKEYFAGDLVIYNKAFFQAKKYIPDTRGFGDDPFAHAGMDSDWELIHRDVLVDEIHVYQGADSDYANGSIEFPFKTVTHALINANWNANSVLVIHPGTYEEVNTTVGGNYFTFDFGKLDVLPPIAIPGGKGSVVFGGPSVDFILFTQLSVPTTIPASYYYKDIVFASKADFRAGGTTNTFIENCEFQKGLVTQGIFPIVKNVYAVGNDSDAMVTLPSGTVIGSELGPCTFNASFNAKDSILWNVTVPFMLDHCYADNVIFKTKNIDGTDNSGLTVKGSLNKVLVMNNCRFYYSKIDLASSVKYSFNNVFLPTAPGYNKNEGTADVEPFTNRAYTTAKEIYFTDLDSDFSANHPRVITVDDDGRLKRTSTEDLFKGPTVAARTEQGRHVNFVLGLDSENEMIKVAQSKIEANGYNTNYEHYVHINNFGHNADSDIAPQKQDGSFLYPYTSLRNAAKAMQLGQIPTAKKGFLIHPGVYDETDATDVSVIFNFGWTQRVMEFRAAIPGTVTIGPDTKTGISTQYVSFTNTPYYNGTVSAYYIEEVSNGVLPFFGIKFTIRVAVSAHDTFAMPYFENCRLYGPQSSILSSTNQSLRGSYFKDSYISHSGSYLSIAAENMRDTVLHNCVIDAPVTVMKNTKIYDSVFKNAVALVSELSENCQFYRCRFESNITAADGNPGSYFEDCKVAGSFNVGDSVVRTSGVNEFANPAADTVWAPQNTGRDLQVSDTVYVKTAATQTVDVDRSFAMMMDSDTGEVRKVSFADIHPGSSMNAVFVNAHTTDIVQDGTFEHPYKTIQQAIQAGIDSEWQVDTNFDYDMVFFPGEYQDDTYNFRLPFYEMMDENPGFGNGKAFGLKALIPGTATIIVTNAGDINDIGFLALPDPDFYPNMQFRSDGKVPFEGLNFKCRIGAVSTPLTNYRLSFKNCRFFKDSGVNVTNANINGLDIVDCVWEKDAVCLFTFQNASNDSVITNNIIYSNASIGGNTKVTNSQFRNKVALSGNATLINCDIWDTDDFNIASYSPSGSGKAVYTFYNTHNNKLIDCRVHDADIAVSANGNQGSSVELINTSYRNLILDSEVCEVRRDNGTKTALQNVYFYELDSEIKTETESKKFLVIDSDGRVRMTQDVSASGGNVTFPTYDYVAATDGTTSTIALTSVAVQIASLTIPSSGTWNLEGNAFFELNAGSASILLYKNGVIIGRNASASVYGDAYAQYNDFQWIGNSLKNVECVAGDVIALKANEPNSASAVRGDLNVPTLNAEKVGGYLPAIGYEAQHSSISFTMNNVVSNTDVLVTTNHETDGIELVTTNPAVWRLKAGVTYELSTNYQINTDPGNTGGAQATMAWYDSSNNDLNLGYISGVSVDYSNRSLAYNPSNSVLFTPSVDTDVKLKVSYAAGTNVQLLGSVVIKAVSKQLPITTQFADASDSYLIPANNSSYSIAPGAQMVYIDGVWQPNVVEGTAAAGVAFANPWGEFTLWFSTSGNRNFRLRNTTGATAYISLSSDYAVYGSAANVHRNSANDVVNGGDLALWSDGGLSFPAHGSWEKANIKIATTRDTMLTGAYTEYEVFCIVGAGYVNNRYTVRRIR